MRRAAQGGGSAHIKKWKLLLTGGTERESTETLHDVIRHCWCSRFFPSLFLQMWGKTINILLPWSALSEHKMESCFRVLRIISRKSGLCQQVRPLTQFPFVYIKSDSNLGLLTWYLFNLLLRQINAFSTRKHNQVELVTVPLFFSVAVVSDTTFGDRFPCLPLRRVHRPHGAQTTPQLGSSPKCSNCMPTQR